MKSLFISSAAVAALILSACGGKTATSDANAAAASDTASVEKSIVGCWYIENVVVSDSLSARPAEITPDVKQYITFRADSTFTANTNCNTIGGSYVAAGDSLKFGDNTFCTEMACDNMTVEDLLKQVLPEVNAIDFENDSIVRLNTSASKYIVLRKAPAEVKGTAE